VVGAGRLGQLVARVLAPRGCPLTVVVRHERHRMLLEKDGIRTVAEREVEAAHADVVVEASGSPEGFLLARRAVRPRGTIVLKSTYADELTLDASMLVVDEITLVGSRCGPFSPAIKLLQQFRKQIDPRPLIEARYALADGEKALEHAARPAALKVLLEAR
jgi:threonine dehydrogenase-like Zn-dependent dehydrogenase